MPADVSVALIETRCRKPALHPHDNSSKTTTSSFENTLLFALFACASPVGAAFIGSKAKSAIMASGMGSNGQRKQR